MGSHGLEDDAQRSHWYENAIGVEPVHVPLAAVKVSPSRGWPEIEGSAVFAGGVAPADVYSAVYGVAVAGATMLCVWAPPSDQRWKVYVVPPRVWGEGAEMELADPTMTVLVNGAVADAEFTTSWSPAGDEANVSVVVIGLSCTVVEAEESSESVAVSWSTRCDGYS